MTVMVRRRAILFQAGLTVIVVIAAAIAGYYSVSQLVAADGGAADAKVISERILFIGIVAATAVVVSAIFLILRARNLTATLDKLVAMNQISGYSADAALGRLGDVGVRIRTILRQIEDLSEKKSVKITSLTGLNEMILALAEQMMVVVDGSGKVLQVSKGLLERLEQPRSEIVGQSIDDLLPEASIAEALREAAATRTPVVREIQNEKLVLNPVINRGGGVAYMVAILTRGISDDIKRVVVADRPQPRRESKNGLLSRFARRFSGRSRR
jgi:transcriptional regulator with PAS, ATPase and Fis domain